MSRSSEIRSQRYKAAKMQRERQMMQLNQEEEEEDFRSPLMKDAVAGDFAPGMIPNQQDDVLDLNEHDKENYNMVPLLADAIRNTMYFRTRCTKLASFQDLILEISTKVTHLEPFEAGSKGKQASPAFCLLFRAMQMGLSRTQLHQMLSNPKYPFVRCLGVLYARYLINFNQLYDWVSPLLNDEEQFSPTRSDDGKPKETRDSDIDKNSSEDATISVGSWVRTIITTLRYKDTLFPRLPASVENEIRRKLTDPTTSESAKSLEESNGVYKPGTKCRAIYWEDGLWYDAQIDKPGPEPNTFYVTFLPMDEYGNQEVVQLKDIEIAEMSKEIPDVDRNKRVKLDS